jgi:tetratricopeptide (TPR) repeat protein
MSPLVVPESARAGSGAGPDFSSLRYLVVDDFDGMRTMLRKLLVGCGAKANFVDTASNGEQAIARLKSEKYGVVLCDFNLGTGKNGHQVLEEAKILQLVGPACAWFMVTAEKTSQAVMGAVECQPDGYLVKPITEAILRIRLTKTFAKKEAMREIDTAMAAKNYLGAIELCDQRLAVDKANANDLLRLKCALLQECGELEQAKELCRSILAERDLPWAKAGLAKACYLSGDFETARTLLQEVVDQNRTYLEAYDWLAKALQFMGELGKAETVLENATQLSPNSVARQQTLGDVALKRGNLDNAERAFRKSVALGENSVLKAPEAYLGLAKTYGAKKNPAEAIRILGNMDQHFDSEEVRIKAKAAEGAIYYDNGDLQKAREASQALGKMLNQNSALDTPARLEIAQFMLATGEKDAAVALLQEEVKKDPEDTALLDQIREVFQKADLGGEGDRLVETSRQAAIEMMNSGALLVRDGKYANAVDAMRRAKEAMPFNARVLFNFAHVAIAHMQQTEHASELAAETRRALLEAHRIAPTENRFAQLMQQLHGLSGATE